MRNLVAATMVGWTACALLTLAIAPAAVGSSESRVASAGHGSTTKYSSTLGIRAEVPPPKGASANAGGTFALTLVHTGSKYTATWTLTFYRLTGKAVAAHIHIGPPSGTGPVVLPLCGPCKSGQTGKAAVPAKLVAALKNQTAYVNIHTAKNPGGEVRGRIYKAA